MVSPAPLAVANPPPLSYAERAKKAQNARHPPQVTQQRPTSQNTPMNNANVTGSAAPNTAASRPAGYTSPPTAPKASPSSHHPGDARVPSTASNPPLASPPKPATLSSMDQLPAAKSNGDVKHNGDSPSSAPSASVPKQAPAPTVNIWAVRKEQQLAARVHDQPRSLNPNSSLSTQSSTVHVLLSDPSSISESSSQPAAGSSRSSNASVKASPTMAATNGHTAPPSEFDDPFIVRPGRSPPHPTPPAIDDAESWPEVGQAATTTSNHSRSDGKVREGDGEKGHEREASQGHGSRKSTSYMLPSLFTVIPFSQASRFLLFLRSHLFCHASIIRIAI
ncbi:hypothetical protein BD413DRAFT_174483 [Trametes elegans]|nr:hypothetical protein BD413DRAFT_174483 [Trametes elegans]